MLDWDLTTRGLTNLLLSVAALRFFEIPRTPVSSHPARSTRRTSESLFASTLSRAMLFFRTSCIIRRLGWGLSFSLFLCTSFRLPRWPGITASSRGSRTFAIPFNVFRLSLATASYVGRWHDTCTVALEGCGSPWRLSHIIGLESHPQGCIRRSLADESSEQYDGIVLGSVSK
jgi:hypothetical protein